MGSGGFLTCPPRIVSLIMLEWHSRKGSKDMGRPGYKPEQNIAKLREAEILLSPFQTVQAAARQLG